MPDFSQVDPSILGISLPPLPTAPRDPSNLYPEEWSNKTWGQQMIYHTGVAYLVGTTVGGVWGLFQGVSKAKKFSSNRTLVMNSIINAVSKRSSMTGNSMGVLVMMFSCYKSLISYYSYREQFWHPVAAGALAGFTFKCTCKICLVRSTLIVYSFIERRNQVWRTWGWSFSALLCSQDQRKLFVSENAQDAVLVVT
jgi:hypothetical protein